MPYTDLNRQEIAKHEHIEDIDAKRVSSSSKISSANSTDANLAADTGGSDHIFTGEVFDMQDFSVVVVAVYSDQDSAEKGLIIEYSHSGEDGTWYWNDKYSVYAMSEEGQGKVFTSNKNARYMRIRYINGTSAQTVFNIQTIVYNGFVLHSSHNISDNINPEDDANLTKSVITGEGDDSIFRNVPTDVEGKLKVNSMPYTYTIAEGDILNHYPLLKFGTRTSVSAGTPSTIWEGPTALYQYMTTAQQLQISSSDANDTLAGSGARKVILFGLDSNYDEISEEIDLNGVTQVTTTESFLRIFRAYVSEVGTFGGSNIGTITVTNNAGTTTQLVIGAGDGQTLMTMWTVPRNRKAFLLLASFSTNSNKGARVTLVTRANDTILYPWLIKYRAYIFSGNENFPFNIPFEIPEKTDIEIRVNTPVASGTTSAGATFELWYEAVE